MATRNASKRRKKTKNKRSSSKASSPTISPDSQQIEAEETPKVGFRSGRRTPGYIPDAVSQRMIKRVALFCGIPSLLGLSSFVLNYFLITGDVIDFPPYFTLVETLVFFGLGFLGISYGVLSASWESQPGSALGWSEFRTNLGNLIQQWREYAAQKGNPSKTDGNTTEEND